MPATVAPVVLSGIRAALGQLKAQGVAAHIFSEEHRDSPLGTTSNVRAVVNDRGVYSITAMDTKNGVVVTDAAWDMSGLPQGEGTLDGLQLTEQAVADRLLNWARTGTLP